MIALLVQHISAVTFDIRRMLGYYFAQMMLCEYFNGKKILINFDIGICPYLSDQTLLNLVTGVVFVMQNAVL